MQKEKSKPVSLWKQLVYGSGDIGLNAMYTLFSSYVLYFYTDVIGMNAAIIGTVILFCRIFDGISDVIAGQWIDKHKSKRGHCLPVLLKWSIPMAISVALVFTVPNSTVAVRCIYVFVTYNLFNTIMYTFVGLAHQTLPSYLTDDQNVQAKMWVYKFIFAGVTQMIMAASIMPMVEAFGGQSNQFAWIKAIGVFGIIGVFFLMLNVFVLEETVENEHPSENLLKGIKYAVTNKYWVIAAVINLCNNLILMFNLSISVYYLNSVLHNPMLMGTYVIACNLPGVIGMIVIPFIVGKVPNSKLVMWGCALMAAAQLAFIFSPIESIPLLIGTALVRGIGFAFPMGLASALVGESVVYGEWKTGVNASGVMFSAMTLTAKIGQGLITSIFGIFLTAVGYDGLKEVQDASTLTGITNFFKIVPFFMYILMVVLMVIWKLDKQMPQIQKDLEERHSQAALAE